MTDPDYIRGLIRKEFNYLTTTYGFVEEFDIDTDNIYSEVRFKKKDWKFSIVTTAHGTKISISLISPKGDFGFLSHYFKTVDTDYHNSESRTNNLTENIKFNSDNLRLNGKDILQVEPTHLTEIMDLIKAEHGKWIKPLLKKQSDE